MFRCCRGKACRTVRVLFPQVIGIGYDKGESGGKDDTVLTRAYEDEVVLVRVKC